MKIPIKNTNLNHLKNEGCLHFKCIQNDNITIIFLKIIGFF